MASLKRMRTVFAIEAKQKLAVLTSALVGCFVEVGVAFAALHRTPADVVHLGDSLFVAELLVLLDKFLAQPHAPDIVVTETYAAG